MVKKVGKTADKGAADDVFDTLVVESKNAMTVVLMLQSKEDEVLVKSCDALSRFVDKNDENKKSLMDLGAIDHLLYLICHEEKTVRRSALITLASMSVNNMVRRQLKKLNGVINKLLALLAPEEDAVIHEFASFCLSHLSRDFTTKAQIVRSGGVDLLLRILASTDPDIQKNAIDTIAQLLQDYQSKVAFRGGIPQIVELLKSEYPVIQTQALVALQLLSQDANNRGVLREIEGVSRIIDFIGRPDYADLHPYAVAVLSNCMSDLTTVQLIKETGGLQRLVSFITDVPAPDEDGKGDKNKKAGDKGSRAGKKGAKGDDVEDKQRKADTSEMVVATLPEVKEFATKALARAAQNAEVRKILHDQEIEKMFTMLLHHEDVKVNVAAANAIGVIAEYEPCRASIIALDGIDPLLKLLKNENDSARQEAAFALSNLNNSCLLVTSEIVRLKGLESLVAGLNDKTRPLAAASCAACLTNACHSNLEIRQQVAGCGAVQSLVSPLSSPNTILQSKASLALAALCLDANSREMLRDHNGVEPLVQLLTSKTDAVRRDASRALVSAGSDPTTATEITRFGALDLLIDIQASKSRKNTFSQLALDKLISNNLSAKYALTGRLDGTDIIKDEFYDCGRLQTSSRFQSLEQLLKEEVNDKRATILVNNKSESQPSPHNSENDLADKNSKSSISGRNSRSSKDKGGKKDKSSKTKLTDDIESGSEVMNSPSTADTPGGLPLDPTLISYYDHIDAKVLVLPNSKEQAITIAQFVAEKMGGVIERGRVASFTWQLPLVELKVETKSNVVNLGNIHHGIHCHRALLYKVLCDRCGVSCSLFRGEYNRSWNEVLLADNVETVKNCGEYKFRNYVVDLVHHPGRLMLEDSAEAFSYRQLS